MCVERAAAGQRGERFLQGMHTMKITGFEILHADGDWRVLSFLKVTTDEGVTGWSEFNESYGSAGLSAVIRALSEHLVGLDPRPVERHSAMLYARTRQAPGGINQQAIAAIENALLDVKARALGIRVCELFGGPVREELRLYWSHCGTYLVAHADVIGQPPLTSLRDVETLGTRVRSEGFTALKTNIFLFDGNRPRVYMPGFGVGDNSPELNPALDVERALRAQVEAFRSGAGPDVEILVDLNFNYRPEGYRRVVRALDDLDLMWAEIDLFDAPALAGIRDAVSTPIASCESLYGRREFKPFLECRSVDVSIIDVVWNGLAESLKIAAMADAYEINVAPHNFYGHLSTLHSAHFSATVPNFRVMEIDIDEIPWKDDLVTTVPEIRNGRLVLPSGPGWGTEVNEEAVRAHPPRFGPERHWTN